MKELSDHELQFVAGGFFRGVIPNIPVIQPPLAHMPEENDDGPEREQQEEDTEEFLETYGGEWTVEFDEDEGHMHGHEEDSVSDITIDEEEDERGQEQ